MFTSRPFERDWSDIAQCCPQTVQYIPYCAIKIKPFFIHSVYCTTFHYDPQTVNIIVQFEILHNKYWPSRGCFILSVMGLYRVSIFTGNYWLSLPAAAWKRMCVNISVDMAYTISEPTLSDKRYWTKQCHIFTVTVPPTTKPLFYALVVFLKKLDVNPKGVHKKW